MISDNRYKHRPSTRGSSSVKYLDIPFSITLICLIMEYKVNPCSFFTIFDVAVLFL
jgi:hypothetical protein